MKKRKIDDAASRPVASDSLRKRPLFWVLLLCLLVAGSIVVSMPLLGDSLGRFSVEETNVIALVPPEESHSGTGAGAGSLRTAGNSDSAGTASSASGGLGGTASSVSGDSAGAASSGSGNSGGTASSVSSDSDGTISSVSGDSAGIASSVSGVSDGIASSVSDSLAGTVSFRRSAVAGDTDGQSDSTQGGLAVSDDTQTWDSETHVNLFRSGYDSTAKSGDGDKIIAPGTSNQYAFSVKNEGGLPLDYAISLEVKVVSEEEESQKIPLEWRLLSGDGTTVSDWQIYNGRTETLKESTLNVRNQDNYTIEWRWAYEQGGGMDETDTMLGNLAVDQPLSVEATIYVHAEQRTDGENPPDDDGRQDDMEGRQDDTERHQDDTERRQDNTEGRQDDTDRFLNDTESPIDDAGRGTSRSDGMPRTGDTTNLLLYVVLLTVSACGLLVLFIAGRRRKRGGDTQNDQR